MSIVTNFFTQLHISVIGKLIFHVIKLCHNYLTFLFLSLSLSSLSLSHPLCLLFCPFFSLSLCVCIYIYVCRYTTFFCMSIYLSIYLSFYLLRTHTQYLLIFSVTVSILHLKVMIERRAYNPVESILQFRRIVEVMARVPGSLNVQNVALHMCSYKMMQILDVDMVRIF